MIRVLKILVIILLSSLAVNSQIYIKPNNSYGAIYNRVRKDSTDLIPTFCGAPSGTASLHSTNQRMSALYYDSCGRRFYVFSPSDSSWTKMGATQINDSMFIVGGDTILIRGTGGGGGISSLNTLSGGSQIFATGTTGTNFGISSSGTTHTFNLPTASASNRGALSSADWSAFNGKQAAGNYITATTGDVTAAGPGSVAATIANNAVTDTKIRQSAGLSVVGKATTGTGNVSDITANTANTVLNYDGTSLNYSKVGLTNAVTGILPIANGGSGTASPGLVAGSNITITGSWPNQTINSTGGGGGSLSQNITGDSIGTGSTMSVRVQEIANDYNNGCYWCSITLSLPKSKLSQIRDTFSIPNDSAHLNIFIGPGTHSYGDDYSRYQKSLVDLLLSKYQFSGPGLFSGPMVNYQYANTVGWTARSLLTSPKGRGLAGYSLISTSSDVTVASGSDFDQNAYNSFQDIIVMAYDTATGGTFSVKVDGVIIDTINTAVGTGLTTHKYHLSANQKHTIVLHEVTAAITHCELLDLYLYTSNKRGVIVNKSACGSTDVTNWTAQPRSLAIGLLQAIPGGPDLIISDLGVNNQNHNIDTIVARDNEDTLIQRWRVANPNVGILLMKGTQYSFARYGTPLYSTSAYNRQLDYLVRKDSVASFDNDKIVGPFPRSLTIGTVSTDSLHPTSQAFYTIDAEWLTNIGAFNVDWGDHAFPNLFTGPDSSHVVNTASSQRYSIWDIHTWKNAGLNHFITVNSTGTQTLDQDITSVNQVNYTSLGGASTAYSWDGSGTFAQPVKSNNVTGSNQLKGRLYIGNANGAEDLDIKSSINGYTIASLNPTANSGFSLLRFKDGAGSEKDWLISLGSSGGLSGAGTPYEANALALTALNGNLNIGSTAAAGVFRIFTGGSTTGNNRLSIASGGAITFNSAYTFPTANGTDGYVLTAHTGGNATWDALTGGVSGSGTSGRVAYWNGSSSLTSDANYLYTTSNNGTLSIGTTNTQGHLNIAGNKDLSATGMQSYLAAATYTDQTTAASGTSSSFGINYIASPTIAAANASVTFPSIQTLLIDPPTAGTNATVTDKWALMTGTNGNVRFQGVLRLDDNLVAGAAYQARVTNVTTSGTLGTNIQVVKIDATGGNITITLPSAGSTTVWNGTLNTGIVYKFIRTDNSGNTVTITAAGGENINGSSSFTITGQYTVKEITATGATAWLITQP